MPLPLTQKRILIAEDERPVRMLIRLILEGAGATVLEAADGEQALRLMELDSESIDAVVSDIGMPRMDGNEFVSTVRQRWGNQHPVVVCSALSAIQWNPSLRSKVTASISKPFVPSELVRVLAVAIRSCEGTRASKKAV